MVHFLSTLAVAYALVSSGFGALICPANIEFDKGYMNSNGAKAIIGGFSSYSVDTTNSQCSVRCTYGTSDGGVTGRTWNGKDLLELGAGDWAFNCQESGSSGCTGSCGEWFTYVYDVNSNSQATAFGSEYDATRRASIELVRLAGGYCPSDESFPNGVYTVPKLVVKNKNDYVDCSAAKFTFSDAKGNVYVKKGNWQILGNPVNQERNAYNIPIFKTAADGYTLTGFETETISGQDSFAFTGDLTIEATIRCGPKCTTFATCDSLTTAPYVKTFTCPVYTISGPSATA